MEKKLTRSVSDKKIMGVCGGLQNMQIKIQIL